MGAGIDAVKCEIICEFRTTNIHEGYDTELTSTILGFVAEGRNFVVRVSDEFDEDFESGQITVDLGELGARLRASQVGKVIVKRGGISSSN